MSLTPGTLVVVDRATSKEAKFLILPSTMPKWVSALQISGQGIKDGECFYRGAPLLKALFGSDNFEIIRDEEFRFIAFNGSTRCLLVKRS